MRSPAPISTCPSLRPRSISRPRSRYRVKVVAYGHAPDIIRESAILGRAIITGVFIYTTLNWMTYRQTRIDIENESDKDIVKDDHNKKKEEK